MRVRALPGNVTTVQLAEWHTWWKRDGARELRALLMDHWDPIGVAEVPEAADEYDTYVGHIGRMLREGKPPLRSASTFAMCAPS